MLLGTTIVPLVLQNVTHLGQISLVEGKQELKHMVTSI